MYAPYTGNAFRLYEDCIIYILCVDYRICYSVISISSSAAAYNKSAYIKLLLRVYIVIHIHS